MAIQSLASHSTAQLRRMIGQIQAEMDVLERLSSLDSEVQARLGYACTRLRDGLEAIEDAQRSLRSLQEVRPTALRNTRPSRKA
ncbi:hypothetical protein [Cupriavidus campinensis]